MGELSLTRLRVTVNIGVTLIPDPGNAGVGRIFSVSFFAVVYCLHNFFYFMEEFYR